MESSKSPSPSPGNSREWNFHSDGGKKKRKNMRDENLLLLESHFQTTQKPNRKVRMGLAELIPGMTERSIQVWFQNRRIKHKKQMAESALQPNQMDSISTSANIATTSSTHDISQFSSKGLGLGIGLSSAFAPPSALSSSSSPSSSSYPTLSTIKEMKDHRKITKVNKTTYPVEGNQVSPSSSSSAFTSPVSSSTCSTPYGYASLSLISQAAILQEKGGYPTYSSAFSKTKPESAPISTFPHLPILGNSCQQQQQQQQQQQKVEESSSREHLKKRSSSSIQETSRNKISRKEESGPISHENGFVVKFNSVTSDNSSLIMKHEFENEVKKEQGGKMMSISFLTQ